jgi:uncharacterized protein YecT (DUF1311 family)
MKPFSFAAMFALMLSTQAFASSRCDGDWMALSSPEMVACNVERSAKIDAKLQRAYAAALKHSAAADHNDEAANARRKRKLIESQRAWKLYRNAQCDYMRDAMGEASEAESWYLGCVQEMAEERIKWLEK